MPKIMRTNLAAFDGSTPMPDPARDTYESLRDGLLQDLIAVRLVVGQAREALPAESTSLRAALGGAGQSLDGDIDLVRGWLDRLRDAA